MPKSDEVKAEARRKLGAAKAASSRAAEAFGRDEIDQESFWRILEREEDLLIAAQR